MDDPFSTAEGNDWDGKDGICASSIHKDGTAGKRKRGRVKTAQAADVWSAARG